MDKKFQTNLLLTKATKLRLKIAAAQMGLAQGDLVAYMIEREFPHNNIEDALCFKQNISNQAA
jgi:hypothetical protein